jgi:hypothetical protein
MTELDKPIFDLASIDLEAEADRGATMQLLAPRDDKAAGLKRFEPTGVTMQVLGADSPTFRANVRAMIDDVARELQEQPKEPDMADKLTRARTAACAVTGWSDNVVLAGEKLEFSRDNAARLFYERPWIGVQVENFRNNAGNFGPR